MHYTVIQLTLLLFEIVSKMILDKFMIKVLVIAGQSFYLTCVISSDLEL